MSERRNIHGTGLLLGRVGVLLRGPSGAGKSLLALLLLDQCALQGEPAWIVADDRIELANEPGGLVMYAPASIAGLVELRGRGIVRRPFVPKASLHLVVDLVEEMERMVEEDALVIELSGVRLARCPVPRHGLVETSHQLLLVREAMREIAPQRAARQKST
ncbi:MAG: hypothetical protein JWR75_2116 [Devosia sp.]|nr:hypothetical protein [Devosia sp.]